MEPQADGNPRFLTIGQVAEELNVGEPLVRSLLKTGELRGIQIGAKKLWRIRREDVEAYISTAYSASAHTAPLVGSEG
jgi:excisionase family DNA binding protein